MSTTQDNIHRFNITECDNKFVLFQQLYLIGLRLDDAPYFRIVGDLDGLSGKNVDHLQITGIEAEDESGDSWAITGIYPTIGPLSKTMLRKGGTFRGSVNTRTRRGTIYVEYRPL